MFDEEDEEEMEMPCMCDCGEVFDLNMGRASKERGSNVTVCLSCHDKQVTRQVIQDQIEELEYNSGNKKEIQALKKKLEELGGEL
jgi:cytochrome c553